VRAGCNQQSAETVKCEVQHERCFSIGIGKRVKYFSGSDAY